MIYRNERGIGMCTAVTYKTKDFYFGRTLDYEFSYGDEITITPRNYIFRLAHMGTLDSHYAMIGMAHVACGYPLYYEAVNEKGLCMAGLNFVGNTHYNGPQQGKDNVAVYELIPWILGKCASVADVRGLLGNINICNTPFNEQYPAASLHWIIADSNEAITLESVKEGLMVYDNPFGVLTNNPPFDRQMSALNNYRHLSPRTPVSSFSPSYALDAYSRGMGAIGLPGDLSSQSRFVRAAFVRANSVSDDSEEASVSQFFHILGSVDQQRGLCGLDDGKYEITIYTSCCNAAKGIYYYTTYNCHQINAVDMHRVELDSNKLSRYRPVTGENINLQN